MVEGWVGFVGTVTFKLVLAATLGVFEIASFLAISWSVIAFWAEDFLGWSFCFYNTSVPYNLKISWIKRSVHLIFQDSLWYNHQDKRRSAPSNNSKQVFLSVIYTE